MSIQDTLRAAIQQGLQKIYNITIDAIEFQATRKDFEGDITVVVFPFLKVIKGNPVQIATNLGEYLEKNVTEIASFNVVQGFLNLVLSDTYFLNSFSTINNTKNFGQTTSEEGKAVMVEYSSPNTNKPLHLGHIRNNLLGYSVAEILKASGKKVYKTQIINDRGIHICKSMLAWQNWGNGETPESTGLKGDKLVGNYYVKFEEELRKQAKPIFNDYRENIFTNYILVGASVVKARNNLISNLEIERKKEIEKVDLEAITKLGSLFKNKVKSAIDNGFLFNTISKKISKSLDGKNNAKIEEKVKTFESIIRSVLNLENKINEEISKINDIARNRTQIMEEAQEMLRTWEAGNDEVVALWKKMNEWVYDGFDITYKNLGVDFDTLYYESNTYLLGKEFVTEGLAKGVFFKKDDGSVWCDLTNEGLDEKIVLRADGTAVYMTQDIGTAIQRIKDHPNVRGLVYTVGNEQDYHFKVLFLILKKLGFDWAENLYHLSYGMVDLPSGKMKSREGTVVDADDLLIDMTSTAKEISEELGKLEGYTNEEKETLYKTIGLGALKYYILKVDPKKRILFDPEASIDFAGNTGPFIQYTYARIQSILRKADFDISIVSNEQGASLLDKERNLIKQLALFPEVIQQAAENYSPALIANYTYDLVKEYNSFYQSVPILGCDNEQEKIFRTQLSNKTGQIIKTAFKLLGIEVPERM